MAEVPLKSLGPLCEEMGALAQNTALLSSSMTFNHFRTLLSLLSRLHLGVRGPSLSIQYSQVDLQFPRFSMRMNLTYMPSRSLHAVEVLCISRTSHQMTLLVRNFRP